MKLTHPVNLKFVRIKQEWSLLKRHKGRDYGWISVPTTLLASMEVRAAAPGKVVRVYSAGGWNEGYGNQVIIQHTDKSWTTYNHFKNGTIRVRVGDTVDRQQLLGTMGATGKVEPAGAIHLHFEVRINSISENNRVNPATYFTKDLPGTPVIKPPVTGSPAGTAYKTVQITTASLNLRAKASASGKVVATMPKNTRVRTAGRTGVWEKVKYVKNGKAYYGYAHASYMILAVRTTDTPNTNLNLRALPSTRSKVLAKIPNKTVVSYTAVYGPGKTEKITDTPWARITYKGKTGWIHRSFVK